MNSTNTSNEREVAPPLHHSNAPSSSSPPPPPPSSQPAAVNMILTEEADPLAMVQSLFDVLQDQKNKQQVIEEVHLTVGPSFYVGSLFTAGGRELMRAFGRIPNLKKMIIRGHFRAPFPVSVVSFFLSQVHDANNASANAVSSLVQFSLFQMTLVGTANEFEYFGRMVGRHSASMEVFDIDMIHLIHHHHHHGHHRTATPPVTTALVDKRSPPALDPLLKALNQSPNLRFVLLGGLEASSLDGAVSPELVHDLFRSKTIRRLSLVNVPISMTGLCTITKLIENNDCLKSLCLSCGKLKISAALPRLAPGGRADPTKKSLPASCLLQNHHNHQEEYELCKASLSSMFQKNNCLEKLILFLPDLDQDEDLDVTIFHSIEKSLTLKRLFLGSMERMSLRSKEALLRMVQKNFVLEEFGMVCANEGGSVPAAAAAAAATTRSSSCQPCCPFSMDTIREMMMLLRLNRDANRGKILQNDNSTRQERIQGLINVRDDLDCIFYLLSRQPTLMDPEALETKKKKKKGGTTNKRTGPKRLIEATEDDATGSTRTRLYRAAKYKRVSYR